MKSQQFIHLLFLVFTFQVGFSVGFADDKVVDFSHEVVPVFKKHCIQCHAGDNKKGGFSLNTLSDLLEGSENGEVVSSGNSAESRLIDVITSTVEGERMPPDGPSLDSAEVEILKRWIDQGTPWESGFAFRKPPYEPPLRPRTPDLPPPRNGRSNPVDRIIDQYLDERDIAIPLAISDEAFLRRTTLDLSGLLPTQKQWSDFMADNGPDKRQKAIDALLADDVAYAEHWLTFWNDLLRNDYDGTGFITGGRKQISGWLYSSLIQNKPYDQFVRELVSPPNDESRGFIDGIQWRGEVSAGQTVEIQFAQSVSQSLLGINLKCASCHDSFIDRWKLEEAYGLAAIYSNKPLEIHRCDKPIGKLAKPSWFFPELGQVDPDAVPAKRLEQLAEILTHPENGRLTRTLVNRLWHRLMGRGVVHPTDAMQTEPWNSDLLDFLASDFAKHNYDIKHTLRLIASSHAYQSRCEIVEAEETANYQYRGPRARRLTAEQFIDSLWQITGAAPNKIDAKFQRGKMESNLASNLPITARWIWSTDNTTLPAAGEKRAFRKLFNAAHALKKGFAVVSCDNAFTLYIDGIKLGSGDQWNAPTWMPIESLEKGDHEILIIAENQENAPNPAGLFAEIHFESEGGRSSMPTDLTWQWTSTLPGKDGKYDVPPTDWKPAEYVAVAGVWASVQGDVLASMARAQQPPLPMVRAALLKSDGLMRSLGRPNRDQIVSMRPNELSTLEAIDLENGQQIANLLHQGAERLLKKEWRDPREFVDWLFVQALSRKPSTDELEIAMNALGDELTPLGVEDLLWAVVMLPEYQIVR